MGYELYLRSIWTDSLRYAAEYMPPVPSVLRGKGNKRELQPLAGVLLALPPEQFDSASHLIAKSHSLATVDAQGELATWLQTTRGLRLSTQQTGPLERSALWGFITQDKVLIVPRRHGFREHFPADVRLVDGGQHVLVAGIDAESPARKLDITTYLYNQICRSMALYDTQLSVVECAQLRQYFQKHARIDKNT